MLRVVAHTSAAAARQYYTEGLKREDYYSEGQEVVGQWHGKAAARLGLAGDVAPEAFAAMVENRHPLTGEKLTPRTKAGRRVGYDLNFHAPKSLSVLQALTNDRRLVTAFREAVAETMTELEERVGTRVRRGGANSNRVTGNIAWAEFVHFTARPVGGIPDPHLHVHAFAFNVTYDQTESRWKAAEFVDVKTDAPYAEAAFHSRLAGKVAALGYQVERSEHGWEVAGVPRSIIDKFSRRKALIEETARRLGIDDAKGKDALGAATREGKRKGLGAAELRKEWKSRLTKDEYQSLVEIVSPPLGRPPAAAKVSVTAREAMDHAFEKCFETESVVLQNRLVAEALKFSVGQLKPDQLWRELSKRDLVARRVKGEILCTTLDVLAEEVALINFVRSGRGKCAPIKSGPLHLDGGKWSKEERNALKSILTSTSQVIAIRGAAGVGKTTLMIEAAAQIEAQGFRIFAFAPSASSSRGTLREAGFAGANTVAHLLQNKRLQQQTRGQFIWIDEAGLVGNRDLWQVMQIAGSGTRVILTGDSYQHAPVPRGDAFRSLQRYAGLRIAEITQIRRQEREIYKLAVAALSRGDLKTAFNRLDELGAIVQVEDEAERYRLLAQDFMSLRRKGSNPPLVVSPTHAEGRLVTEAIRSAKRDAGKLKDERDFLKYENLQWDNADKKRAGNYREGLVVQFHQNAKGILRGAMLRVSGVASSAVTATDEHGNEVTLPLQNAERFQVFAESSITLGKGDQVRITRNGDSADGRRLNNGDVFAVQKFTRKGNIVLSNGAELDAKHGHVAHGYCSTSHSSQSKSVRDVLVAQSAKSFVASSREQFYVSVSRGKQSVRIYTDDLRGLREAVGITSTRMSGIELAGLTSKEVAAMSTALNSRQWTDAIKSRFAEGRGGSHVQNLMKQRHQDGLKKADKMSWRAYVEMRRGNAGPDGKSRSKGRPAPEKKSATAIANKRRFYPGPHKHSAPVEKQMKAAHEAKKAEVAKPKETPAPEKKPAPKAKTRTERMENALKSAASHFRKNARVPKEQKQDQAKAREVTPQPGKAKMQASTIKQAAKRAVRSRAAEPHAGGETRKKSITKQQPVVRPPTPRK